MQHIMKGASRRLKELHRTISYIKQFAVSVVKEHSCSLDTCMQSGTFHSVMQHVGHRAISVINELKAI